MSIGDLQNSVHSGTAKFPFTILQSIVPFLIILFSVFSVSTGNAQTIAYGDTMALGGGIIYTWVEVDPENAPLKIGIAVSEAAVEDPEQGVYSIDFPRVASDSLFIHAATWYEPMGHPPLEWWGVPHFDFHFYMIPEEERLAIPAEFDTTEIPDEFMPEDYIHPAPDHFSIPEMGVHFVDSLAAELHGEPFTESLIYGFYQGEMIFIEPMITNEYLLTYPADTIAIKQPQAYQRSGYYPMTYLITYNDELEVFDIVLTDFEYRAGVVQVVENTGGAVPESFVLLQNYPNPFNPSTTIGFSIPERTRVNLTIYDILGRKVTTLVDEELPAGDYSTRFDAHNLTSGVYLYQLRAGEYVETKRLMLVK